MTHLDQVKPAQGASSDRATEPPAKSRDEKIDAQVEDSFPASDPPSFSGGTHIIGAPEGRESPVPTEGEIPSHPKQRR